MKDCPSQASRLKGYLELEFGGKVGWILIYPEGGDATMISALEPKEALNAVLKLADLIRERGGPDELRKVE